MKTNKLPTLWWIIYCSWWVLLLVFLLLMMCGCAPRRQCVADNKPRVQRTHRWDTRRPADTGYHYPRNRHSTRDLKGPNVDNRKCQRPYWYNHSKCCRRSP